jgi:hypothetical protein
VGYIFWMLLWTGFGALMGYAGWQEPYLGAFIGFMVGLISSTIAYAKSPAVLGGAESLLDDIMD